MKYFEITIEDKDNIIYSGSELKPNITVTDATTKEIVPAENYEVLYDNNINVGTATVKVIGKGGSYGGEKEDTFQIKPKPIHIEWGELELVYNGESQLPKANSTDFVDPDNCNIDVKLTKGDAINVGNDYKAKAVDIQERSEGQWWVPSENYVFADDSLEIGFSIIPLTISDETKLSITLDEEEFEYTGKEIEPNESVVFSPNPETAKALEKDRDYVVSYENNKDVGEAKVKISSKADGNYSFEFIDTETGATVNYKYAYFNITAKKLNDVTVDDIPPQIYTGNPIEPKPIVRDTEETLTENVQYKIEYIDNINVGTAKAIISPTENYSFSPITKEFSIGAIPITDFSVSLDGTSFEYSKTENKPNVTVESQEGKILEKDIDFQVAYENNINVGTANVVVTGIGNYSGTVEKQFEITAKKVNITWGEKDFIYNGQEQKPIATVNPEDLIPGDVCDAVVSIKEEKSINAGTYHAFISSLSNTNYCTQDGTSDISFTIAPKSITPEMISLDKNEFRYDGEEKSPVVTVKDSEYVLEATVDYSLNGTLKESNIGDYTITIIGMGNYKEVNSVEWHITKDGGEFIIKPSCTENGGTIDPSEPVKVNKGDSATFTATANSGYHFKNFVIDGDWQTTEGINTYEFTDVEQSHTIFAVFVRDDAPKVISINIEKMPTKTVYDIGESFDPTGMVVTATFDDKTKKEITDYTVVGFDSSTVGIKTLTVVYADQTAELQVTIQQASIGWKLFPDGYWRYLENGSFAVSWRCNIPGWGNSWFYFDQEGRMLTGWQINIPGWVGQGFYFNPNGTMAVGWRCDIPSFEGKWFYFYDNGVSAKGWKSDIVNYEGKWFYFDFNSIMQTGWIKLDAWYCLADNGVMYVNCITPDGYRVDENGRYIA